MTAELPRFSIGVGDRFAHQARPQLRACMLALDAGVEVIPVWNKSNREHTIIGSQPSSVRHAADQAVRDLGWTKPYFIDADHINFDTAGGYFDSSDFFTIDVADWIGKPADPAHAEAFAAGHPELANELRIPGISRDFRLGRDLVEQTAAKYLRSIQEAGRIYRKIEAAKGAGRFITEVSMDETDRPQTPVELLVILAAIADEGIPIQTIAPKFTGRFNKGVDYVGDPAKFAVEFAEDVAAIAFAIHRYGLPQSLKLSVHSGSDKFSIYSAIHETITTTGAGVHLKTAGTTWLEELIGLAESEGEGLRLAKDVYAEAYEHREALAGPYAAVIDVDEKALPAPAVVQSWTAGQFVTAMRHDPRCPHFNPSLRQLLHIGFKVAARMGTRYLEQLKACEENIARNVTTNLFERHIRPVFLGQRRELQ